jgi:hypothetical protein
MEKRTHFASTIAAAPLQNDDPIPNRYFIIKIRRRFFFPTVGALLLHFALYLACSSSTILFWVKNESKMIVGCTSLFECDGSCAKKREVGRSWTFIYNTLPGRSQFSSKWSSGLWGPKNHCAGGGKNTPTSLHMWKGRSNMRCGRKN